LFIDSAFHEQKEADSVITSIGDSIIHQTAYAGLPLKTISSTSLMLAFFDRDRYGFLASFGPGGTPKLRIPGLFYEWL